MRGHKNLYLVFTISFILFFINSSLNPYIITLAAKETCSFQTGSLFKIDIENSQERNINIRREEEKTLLIPKKTGSVKAQLLLFEHLKLKEILVNVVDEEKVIAMGNAVGLRLCLEGLLIEALTGVEGQDGKKYNPLKEAGLKKGDIIIEVDNEVLRKSEDLIKEVNLSNGRSLNLKIKRNNDEFVIDIQPIKATDGKYHIGIWVKDTINGIGTVTYCDQKTMEFGALGHGISDEGENSVFPITGGEAFGTEITSVKKGIKGVPGELKGNLMMSYNIIGAISLNTNNGVFGYLDKDYVKTIAGRLLPIGYKEYVKEGRATIFTNIEKNKIEEYEVEIQKIISRPFGPPKGMIVRIVDDRLIKVTGGIVQGMSGSPIIQNNRIIGAITHVLINDPLRGYGVFIENMFDSGNLKNQEIM